MREERHSNNTPLQSVALARVSLVPFRLLLKGCHPRPDPVRETKREMRERKDKMGSLFSCLDGAESLTFPCNSVKGPLSYTKYFLSSPVERERQRDWGSAQGAFRRLETLEISVSSSFLPALDISAPGEGKIECDV